MRLEYKGFQRSILGVSMTPIMQAFLFSFWPSPARLDSGKQFLDIMRGCCVDFIIHAVQKGIHQALSGNSLRSKPLC